ncbi:MAG: MaoC family dehydratase [Burkholderiales bacterium]|nr:MaoC family dehydratase [Burkholderiales bacterium]
MRFAELTVGRVIECGPASLTEREIVDFARRYDPQWFHTDPERARSGPWQGLIASGWQTCGVAMRMVCDDILSGSETFGSPGLAYLKWDNPVRAGDELRVVAEVQENRIAKRRPTLGILRWHWRMTNQRGEAVLELEATNFFDLQRDSGFNASARA